MEKRINMKKNLVITSPRRGDIVYLDSDKTIRFLACDTYDKASFPGSNTLVGVVVNRQGNRLLIADKNQTSKKWSDVFRWETRGWNLDGGVHTATIKFYESQPAPTNPTFQYSATSLQEVVTQLNIWFEQYFSQTNIRYFAYVENDALKIICETFDQWYRYVLSISGITVSYDVAQEVDANSNTYAINGIGSLYKGINWQRFYDIIGNSTSSTFNPKETLDSLSNYPTSRAYYLGEKGVNLRALYGEGEGGYVKYLKDYMIKFPGQRGVFGDQFRDSRKATYTLAGIQIQKHDGSKQGMYPVFDYVAGISYDNPEFAAGKWFLPSMFEMMKIFADVEKEGGVYVDAPNRSLKAIGGTQITFEGSSWSSSRSYDNSSWYVDSHGYSVSDSFYSSLWARGFSALNMNEVNN